MALADDDLWHVTRAVLVFLNKFEVKSLCHGHIKDPEGVLGKSLTETDTFPTIEGDPRHWVTLLPTRCLRNRKTIVKTIRDEFVRPLPLRRVVMHLVDGQNDPVVGLDDVLTTKLYILLKVEW